VEEKITKNFFNSKIHGDSLKRARIDKKEIPQAEKFFPKH